MKEYSIFITDDVAIEEIHDLDECTAIRIALGRLYDNEELVSGIHIEIRCYDRIYFSARNP
jgi:hypothetical protein